MYQIFLLDIDNTLLDFDAAEKKSFKKIIQSSDIQGAINAGIGSCLFCPSGPNLQSKATHTIHDLSELLNI